MPGLNSKNSKSTSLKIIANSCNYNPKQCLHTNLPLCSNQIELLFVHLSQTNVCDVIFPKCGKKSLKNEIPK